MEKNPSYDQYLVSTGLGLILVMAMTYIFASLFMIVGGALNQAVARGILIAAIAVPSWLICQTLPSRRDKALVSVMTVAGLVLCTLISGVLMDTSIDGQAYHFHAVESLASGWNPFHDSVPPLPHTDNMPPAIWVSHYPMGSWMVSAVGHAAGLPLESSKGLNLVVFAGSALLTIGVLMRLGFGWITALLAGGLAAANPVTVGQLFTRMNDGLMGSLILGLIMLAIMSIHLKDRRAMLYMVPIMILTLNLKFSAIPVLVALCGYLCIAAWVLSGRNAALKTAGYLAVAGVIGIFAIGFAPYGNNILGYGHPFYPIMGPEGTRDIMTSNTPPFIEAMNPVQAFFYSLLAESHSGFGSMPSLKLPFALSAQEIRTSGGPDVRIGGFGPLFSGGMLLALIAGLVAAIRFRTNGTVRASLVVAVALFVLALIFPESWWARYVPYLWLVPLCVALANIASPDHWQKIAGFAIIAVLGVNAGLTTAASLYLTHDRTTDAKAQIQAMKAAGGEYDIYFDLAFARSEYMRRTGIDFNIVGAPVTSGCASVDTLAAYGPDLEGGHICRLPSRKED